MAIKFNQYHVTNGTVKARVYYSLDGRTDGRKCVTMYAKDYCGELGKVFAGGEYKNDSDIMTDYFDKGQVVLFEDHPVYGEARGRVEEIVAAREARYAAKAAARAAA